ncbi:MAG: hypothetical protein SGBAC_006380 [Bacillariaceae sp.]
MPVSPRNQDDLATLDSNNPASGNGKVSVLESKIASTNGAMSKYTAQPIPSTETRDEIPKADFDTWLRCDSDDLSLYYDESKSSDDQTESSNLIASSIMDQRDGAATSVASDPEKKQELEVTLQNLGIDLNGQDLMNPKDAIPIAEETVDESKSTDGSSSENKFDEDCSTLNFSVSVPDAESAKGTIGDATPNLLPASKSEEERVGPPTDSQLKNMLKGLQNSKTLAEADESIKALDMALDNRVVPDKTDRIHIADTITKLDGNHIIMEAMEKWQTQSSEIADVATCLMVALTQILPEASKAIAKVGLDNIVKTAKGKPNNYFLRGNVLALLLNLSTLEDETTKKAISTDSCIDVVVQTMQKWPDKAYIQKCGAGYFVRINMMQAEEKENAKLKEEEQAKDSEEVPVVAVKEVPKIEAKAATQTLGGKPPVAPQQGEIPPSEEEVAKMLRKLRDTRNGESAAEAVKTLVRATDSRLIKSVADRKNVAERIVRMNGVAAIILALEKWFAKSENFAYYAMTVLVSVSKFAGGSRQTIATIGCKTVLDTAGRYADDYYIRGNVLFLLQNLANHKHAGTKYEVAESDCIDCVVDTMQRWPDDESIQHCGCDYFARIVSISGMPAKLHAREIDVLLLGVMDTFQQKQNEKICDKARAVMDKIHQDE